MSRALDTMNGAMISLVSQVIPRLEFAEELAEDEDYGLMRDIEYLSLTANTLLYHMNGVLKKHGYPTTVE